jgi:hypothetical protein
LTAGWRVVDVIRKPEGSLFGSIVAVPVSVPHSRSIISQVVDKEIYERCTSPVGDTFYSKVELPAGRGGLPGSVSDSAVMKMKKRIRKTLSKTFGSGFGAVQVSDDEKQMSQSSLLPTCFHPGSTTRSK